MGQSADQAQQRLMLGCDRSAVEEGPNIHVGNGTSRWEVDLMHDDGESRFVISAEQPLIAV
jgi:hypothetical protein